MDVRAKECTARAPTEYGHPRNVSFQVQILIHLQNASVAQLEDGK